MSRGYNITRRLLFNDSTGYWDLTMNVNSADNLNPRVFLVEKYVAAGQSIASSTNPISYTRTLLRNEPISVTTETNADVSSLNGWISFRTHSLSKSFYTYEDAFRAQSSILATLKSNAQEYTSLRPKKEPRLVVINMSSKDKAASSDTIEAYKGDVISLQLADGPRCEEVVSDGQIMAVGSLDTRRVTTNSVSIKLLEDSHTYLGLKDSDTGIEYKVSVTMLATQEDEVTENV